jgi:ABC-2 type transport system ATP-binding protein
MAGESPSADPAVVMKDVTVAFGPVQALDSVSFEVPSGSVTGLVGRNGAGKSTSIRCMAGLLDPSHGESVVRILGREPRNDHLAIVTRTGFLLSEPALFPYLTPLETLAFLARGYGIDHHEAARRAEDLLRFFDLTDAADRLADQFSTGMKKRLALAASMIHAPDLLVLDEPFESLDPLMVRAVKRLLLAYAAGGGTILLSSHLIDAVEEICDRVIILEQGRIVASGTTSEVKSKILERLPSATLEDLYASLVPESDAPEMAWLTGES